MLSEKPKSMLSETRKVTKSTMEKKRRARINSSLIELKNILSGMVANKGERFEKMEKADILELTVNCVKQLQKQSNTVDQVSSSTPTDSDYRTGMHTCIGEVVKFLSTNTFDNIDPETKTKLLDHLANKLTNSSDSPNTHARPHTYRNFHTSHSGQTILQHCPVDYSKQPLNRDILSKSPSSTQSFCDDKNGDDSNNNSVVSKADSNIRISIADSNILSPMVNPVSPNIPTLLTPSLQQALQTSAVISTANSVPTVPFLLVPANLCSSTFGASYVFPLTIPGQTTPLFQASPDSDLSQQSTVNHGQQIQDGATKPLPEGLQPTPKTVPTIQNTNSSSTAMVQGDSTSLPCPLPQTPLKINPSTHVPVPTPARPILLSRSVTNNCQPGQSTTFSEHMNLSSANTHINACQARALSSSTSDKKPSGFQTVKNTSESRDSMSSTFLVRRPKALSTEDTLTLAKRTAVDKETDNHVRERHKDVPEMQKSIQDKEHNSEAEKLSANGRRQHDRLPERYRSSDITYTQPQHNVGHVQERLDCVQDSHENICVQEQFGDGQDQQRNVNNGLENYCHQPINTVWRPWW